MTKYARAILLTSICSLSIAAPVQAQSAGAAPAAPLDAARASANQAMDHLSQSIDREATGLTSFVQKAEVAKDKAMDRAGAAAKARIDAEIVKLLADAVRAMPATARLEPVWQASDANDCRIGGATAPASSETAKCVANGVQGGTALARGQGEGASATSNAFSRGKSNARAQGAKSQANAKAGDTGRTGQDGNLADAIATGGSNATASSGVGDHDQFNASTAAATDGSLANAETLSGDNNKSFSGATNKGEARSMTRAGDRNIAIAYGTNGSNDGNGPGGARSTVLIGFDNVALSLADGVNSNASGTAGYGDRHRAAARSGANSHSRADAAQGEENRAFSEATDRGHALSYTSYGDHLLAISKSRGDGSTGQCAPIGRPQNSGETNYPPDECATANARSVDGEANTAIAIVDKAKAYSVAERGARNTSIAKASNGGNIIWNTAQSVTTPSTMFGGMQMPAQAPNPHAGMKADCPWPLPPLPQPQQACGNATAKASYGDGNLAVALPDGDHSFAWSEASGGSYNQTLATANGTNPQARARAIYTNYATAKAMATDGGKSDSLAVMGYQNVAVANAVGAGSDAKARAAGPYAKANAAASGGGSAVAAHNTATTPQFMDASLKTEVTCSATNVAYAMIGSGQTCGKGF